jgi:hypothetical protein
MEVSLCSKPHGCTGVGPPLCSRLHSYQGALGLQLVSDRLPVPPTWLLAPTLHLQQQGTGPASDFSPLAACSEFLWKAGPRGLGRQEDNSCSVYAAGTAAHGLLRGCPA